MVHPDLGRIGMPRPCAPMLVASSLPTLLGSLSGQPEAAGHVWAKKRQQESAAVAASYVPAAALGSSHRYTNGPPQRRRPMTAAPRVNNESAGPSDQRPHTAGALRGGDGGGHGGRGLPGNGPGFPRPAGVAGVRPEHRVPAWGEHVAAARSLLRGAQLQQGPLQNPKRRRGKRPRTAPGHPRAGGGISDTVPISQATGIRSYVHDQSTGSDKPGKSSIFSAPDSPSAPRAGGKFAAELATQESERSALHNEAAMHRDRPWVNEREQSRSMPLRLSAHSWKGKRAWRMRCMEIGLASWRGWVEEHQQFVVQIGFAIWVWRRYCDRRINQRRAAEEMVVSFDALRCRQICRAWMHYSAGVKEMETKWRGLLLERQMRTCGTVLDAWHSWASLQAETGRRVLSAMLRSQHSWMKAMRFAQLRLYAFCRARRRERRQLFGQQLTIGLGGHKTLTNVPDLPFPQPIAPAGVDKKALEHIGMRFRQNDIRDLAACQWRFSHEGRRMFVAWAKYVDDTKKIHAFTERRIYVQAFKTFKQRVRWSRTQREINEAMEEKRRLDRIANGESEFDEELEDLMLPSEKKKRRQAKLQRARAGTAAAAAVRAEQEAQYRKRIKAAAELKAREEAEEAEMQARIAAIMSEEGGQTLGDLMAVDSSEEEAVDEDVPVHGGASEDAALRIQSVYRGHAVRLGLMDESARELYELRRELAQVDSQRKKLSLQLQSMEAEQVSKEQQASIGDLAAIKSAHKDALNAQRKHLRSLDRERNLILKDIEAASRTDHSDESEENAEASESARRSKYARVLEEAAKHIDSAKPHLKQVRRREKRVIADIERINAEQERLAAKLAKRNSEFAAELERLELRMQERLALSQENPIFRMLDQLCDAFSLALEAVARARLRNHTILAFLRLAKPVQLKKARAHYSMHLMRTHVNVWRSFTTMMRAIRETAHVRFRCFYTWFRHWKVASRASRIYRSRGLRREIEYRRCQLRKFSVWLHEAPHHAYRCGRYALFARWIEFTQRNVARRSISELFQKLCQLHKRRQAYAAMFLGLKPQHHGERAMIGYVEKNLMADLELWQHCLRGEVGLVSDRHRRVNGREQMARKLLGKGTMTGRRRLAMAELGLKAQIKHEHALSLEAFHDRIEWVPHWGTVFDMRSSQVLRYFEAAKQRAEQMMRMQKDPRTTDEGVKLLCRSERFRVSIALWLMRARVKESARLTAVDAKFLTKSARRIVTRFAQDAIELAQSV